MKAIENKAADFIFDNNDVGGTGAANNASYFAVAPTSGVRVSVTNTPITNITNRVYVQDLINDPQTKNSLIAPIIKQLTAYGASLDDLEQTDTDYGAQIAEQQARLSAAKSCFDSITTRYAPYTNDPNVIASQDKIKSLQDKIDTARATITSDAASISTARSLITTTRNAVTNSNSSNQINDLFSAYQNAIDSQDLPSITASSDRMSLFEKLRTALQGPTGSTKDQITLLQEQCTTLEQQIPAGTPDVPPVDGGGGAGDGGSGGY
jgi:chromosome segregation ATPase